MIDSLFKEGGPHNVKRMGPDQYTMSIEIPKDADGLVGRECQNPKCSPGYFKVKPGTGITKGQEKAYCPYCLYTDNPSNFRTEAQVKYAKDLVIREAHKGINKIIESTLGLGPSRKKRFGGDFISIDMSYKPGSLPNVRPPMEEELRRDLPVQSVDWSTLYLVWLPGAPIAGLTFLFPTLRKSLWSLGTCLGASKGGIINWAPE